MSRQSHFDSEMVESRSGPNVDPCSERGRSDASSFLPGRSSSWHSWWYDCKKQFFPLIRDPSDSAEMEEHRRFRGQIHRELELLCLENQKSLQPCSFGSDKDNDVRMDETLPSTSQTLPSSSLIIQQRLLEKIYSGQKSWELRSKSTKKRGRIGLISSGSCRISGEACLVDCFCLREVDRFGVSRFPLGSFTETFEKHRCTEDEINFHSKGSVYAWVLVEVTKYETSFTYHPSQGSVVWVKTN